METERIELESNLSINKITEEREIEIQKLLQSIMPVFTIISEYAFEYSMKKAKVIGNSSPIPPTKFPIEDVRKKFDKACSALRLFKKDPLEYSGIIKLRTAWPVVKK